MPSIRLVLSVVLSLSPVGYLTACEGESGGIDGGGGDAGVEAAPDATSDAIIADVDANVACGPGGTVVAGRCVCEPGHSGDECRDCQPGYEAMGDTCAPLATDWMPYTADENFDRGAARITGFPAVVSYAAGAGYPAHVGRNRATDTPVGDCSIVDNALLGVAPALRCTWGMTYEESADPSMGGDPYGYGQTYLGAGGVSIDPALGSVTALSIAFVWQFGAGWVEAMQYRDDHRFETLWSGEYADIEVGGSGGKPLITHRSDCEYWYDVSAVLGPASGGRMTGTLEAPDGLSTDSVEVVMGSAFLRGEGGTLYNEGGSAVGTIGTDGAYDFALPAGVGAGTTVTAFYRTEPPGGDPEQARFQRAGMWRRPLSTQECRERPMMLSRTISAAGSGGDRAEPAMVLSMGDDIACYCWDYDGAVCNESGDAVRRVQFRIGDPVNDIPGEGVYHVGVAEPIYVEMLIDTVNGVLDLRVTTPDGRFDDTLVSHSSFCDSPDNGAIRNQPNPHREGHIHTIGEPFWALPLTSIPANAWHQVGQWRITGATDGTPLPRQGPPLGFVRR